VPVVAGLGPPQAAWAVAMGLAGLPRPAAVATALASQAVILGGIVALALMSLLAGRAGLGRDDRRRRGARLPLNAD
jgi:hypothetical protein